MFLRPQADKMEPASWDKIYFTKLYVVAGN